MRPLGVIWPNTPPLRLLIPCNFRHKCTSQLFAKRSQLASNPQGSHYRLTYPPELNISVAPADLTSYYASYFTSTNGHLEIFLMWTWRWLSSRASLTVKFSWGTKKNRTWEQPKGEESQIEIFWIVRYMHMHMHIAKSANLWHQKKTLRVAKSKF